MPSSDVLLADGTIGVLRPITPEDRDDVMRLHEGLSSDERPAALLQRQQVCGAAVRRTRHGLVRRRRRCWHSGCGGTDRLVGIATAEVVEPTSAEIAFVVSDAAHGLGIATLLLEHLAAAGACRRCPAVHRRGSRGQRADAPGDEGRRVQRSPGATTTAS